MSPIDRAFWMGRRVFLTGHTGFKGAWLTLMLETLGAHVTGYSLPAPVTDPAMFTLLDLENRCDHRIGDIRDLASMEMAMAAAKPDVVFHLAAQPLVRRSYVEPVETYATNLMGTVNLLDACRRMPSLRTIIVVTTDKCYENRGIAHGFVESDPMGGHDPYSNSKGCAELAAAAYRDSFFQMAGIGLATARAGNVIGGGDFAEDRLVPDAVRAFSANRPLHIRNPHAVRPWQHVLEPLVGYLLLAEKLSGNLAFAEGWNFGPDVSDAAPVEKVVDTLTSFWGDSARWTRDDSTHPYEAPLLMLDCAKAHDRLGWSPSLTLYEALSLSVEWYRGWREKGDLTTICKHQINHYLSM